MNIQKIINDFLTKQFERIYYIEASSIGGLVNRINFKGLIFFLLKGLPSTFITKSYIKNINIKNNSLLVSFGGLLSIEKSIFYNFSNHSKNIKSLLISDNFLNAKLIDFKYAVKESLYFNFYQYFHGKNYIDIFRFKSEGISNQKRGSF